MMFILKGLFAIAIIGLLYWLFLDTILQMHVAINENTNERHAIQLANVLISSEKLAYENDGKMMRGILDVDKLDEIFVISGSLNLVSIKDIGIGYPNSLTLVRIIDLEKCNSFDICDGWIGYLSGPITLQGLSIVNFGDCVSEHAKADVGSLFRGLFTGPALAWWNPLDLANCAENNLPSSFKLLFTDSQITSEGFPIVIKYPNGDMHLGRIYVLLGEFS
jgi:hypothetical protein